MKTKNRTNRFGILGMVATVLIGFSSCSKSEDATPVKEGIQKSALIFTKVTGEAVHPHGDHFHGLAEGKEGQPVVIEFNEVGVATKNGHLHIDADAVYKIELKAWDHTGKEVQTDFIANKTVADQYKAFLLGGNFKLNPSSATEQGAVFQPREATYADGKTVVGKYEATGVLSYFTVGEENEGPTKDLTYVLRKLKTGVKEKIERTDWNRVDYSKVFEGENVLELKFQIHAEHGHAH